MKNFLILITFILLVSCSSVKESLYPTNYPLTKKSAKTEDGIIYVKVPKNWINVEDNKNNVLELWLVSEDFTNSINLTRLKYSEKLTDENYLSELKKFSKLLVKAELGKSFELINEEEFFVINDREFCSYSFTNDNNEIIRNVIFKVNDFYFELSAKKTSKSFLSIEELFNIQNSVLGSIY